MFQGFYLQEELSRFSVALHCCSKYGCIEFDIFYSHSNDKVLYLLWLKGPDIAISCSLD